MKYVSLSRVTILAMVCVIGGSATQVSLAQDAAPIGQATQEPVSTGSASSESTSPDAVVTEVPATPVPDLVQSPVTTDSAPIVEAPTVAQLNPVTPPPAGKGQIVFFRPSRLVGAALSFSVREGDAGIGKLTNGTYFVHVADPGVKEYNISFEARDTLRMEVDEGETYYVIQAIGMGVVAARPNLTPSTEIAFQAKRLKVSKAKPTDRN